MECVRHYREISQRAKQTKVRRISQTWDFVRALDRENSLGRGWVFKAVVFAFLSQDLGFSRGWANRLLNDHTGIFWKERIVAGQTALFYQKPEKVAKALGIDRLGSAIEIPFDEFNTTIQRNAADLKAYYKSREGHNPKYPNQEGYTVPLARETITRETSIAKSTQRRHEKTGVSIRTRHAILTATPDDIGDPRYKYNELTRTWSERLGNSYSVPSIELCGNRRTRQYNRERLRESGRGIPRMSKRYNRYYSARPSRQPNHPFFYFDHAGNFIKHDPEGLQLDQWRGIRALNMT